MTPAPTRRAAGPSTLMLVSARAGSDLRRAVADGSRPCPEFLRLEASQGVSLLDWTALGHCGGHRSTSRSLRHVATALRRLGGMDAVFSDGEHLGVPLALAMRATRRRRPHLVIGHDLARPAKQRWLRWARAHGGIDRILVHSADQLEILIRRFHLPASLLRVVPYGIDTGFWSPQPVEEENLIVSAGREHRDHETLVRACPTTTRLFVTDSSAHSPHAQRREPIEWPANVERRGVDFVELRDLYARASVVVVPLLASTSSFGVTALLEAMAVGKAVVATRTDGLRGLIEDGVSGVLVEPGDAVGMQAAIVRLLADPAERARLGRAARLVVAERYGLDVYVSELGRHLREIA